MSQKRGVQIFFASIVATTLLYGTSHAETPLAAHFKYVSDAVNEINFLWAKSDDPEDNAKEIAEQACKMLTQLDADPQFKEMIIKTFHPVPNAHLKNTLLDLAQVNDLIDKEGHVLHAAGVNRLTSIQALAAAIPFAKTIDMEKVNPETILRDVSELKERSCSVLRQVEHGEHQSMIKRTIAFGASGVAIVVADGIAEYISAGSATLLAGFSLATGAGMAAEAAHDLVKP